MKRMDDLLANQGGNYILPFFWLHGETDALVIDELNKVAQCGIREICVESRPHPDFAGPQWWHTMDLIMNEAQKKGMRVWVLDDNKFPTGHANYAFAKKYPALRKTYLAEIHFDFLGPAQGQAMLYRAMREPDAQVLHICAVKRPSGDSTDLSPHHILNLTSQMKDDFVFFDLPEGFYRVFILYKTQHGGGREHYMNLLNPRSVDVLINEVYEQHYRHYGAEFGRTFAGFFSDEPELGNTPGYDFQEKLGKANVKLPWSDELAEALQQRWGKDYASRLPALWFAMGRDTPATRSGYMDEVTRLVHRCFSGRIGAWCEERGVEYIGHVIEDDNAHMRLGCSIGHYFREMQGQHRAGVDVVHHQITPGHTHKIHQWIAWDSDGEFFHYALAKLGSSSAQIDPKKQGRALCEIYGNYGWATGISAMKWLADHMLVRGINHFVPHAFSMIFPDRDCPPHFYARGNNPQYPYFKVLMRYLNRLCHLLNGGVRVTDAAVLYSAESEWAGGYAMLFQKPCRALMENQLDFDIVPADSFAEDGVKMEAGFFSIHQASYHALVIPGCDYLPPAAHRFTVKAAENGIPVFVLETLPLRDTNGQHLSEAFFQAVQTIPLPELADQMRALGTSCITCETNYPDLRFMRYRQDDGNLFLFFNESVFETVDTMVTLNFPPSTCMRVYHAENNTAEHLRLDNNAFHLHLEPGQTLVFEPLADLANEAKAPLLLLRQAPLDIEWRVSAKAMDANTAFAEKYRFVPGELPNLNGPRYDTGFSGVWRYEGLFAADPPPNSRITLYFPAIGDCGQVWVNGEEAGCILRTPARLDVTDRIQSGENELIVEVCNTLVWQVKDPVSAHVQLAPTGITQMPAIEYYGKPR